MSKNEKTKWIIGLIVTVCLAISGWLFGSLQTANAQTHDELADRQKSSDAMTREFMDKVNIDISEIKTDLKYMKESLKFILDKLGAH